MPISKPTIRLSRAAPFCPHFGSRTSDSHNVTHQTNPMNTKSNSMVERPDALKRHKTSVPIKITIESVATPHIKQPARPEKNENQHHNEQKLIEKSNQKIRLITHAPAATRRL